MTKAALPLILLAGMLLACVVLAEAQQAGKVPRIGYVSGTGDAINQGPYVEALRQGLRELGYVEGKNFVIEYRGAEGELERIPSLVKELVELKVDILVVPIPSAIRAAIQTTKTIPVVIVSGQDPVAEKWIDSLAHPGGNVTGLTTLSRELSGKRLELLKEIVPRLSRVGVLRDADSQSGKGDFNEYKTAAREMKLQIQTLDVRGPSPDLERAFQAAVKARTQALVTITNANLLLLQKRIAELAIKKRLPSAYQGSSWVEAGGLMSYSTSDIDAYRRAARYIDKILKGTKPTDLPVERPMKFEFVINLKTAKQIGLTIPQWTLMKADKVIK
jgi:ABC-type uncharacterized transport system substrate-binding protein